MRLNWIPGVIIGFLILYVGLFGLAGFGLQWTSGSLPTTENFDNISGWEKYSAGGGQPAVIAPAGQLNLIAGPPSSDSRSAITTTPGLPIGSAVLGVNTWTMSILMQIDNYGAQTGSYLGGIGISFYDSSWWFWLNIDGVGVLKTNSGGTWAWTKDNAWHTWTFLVTRSGSVGAYTASVDVYFDTQKKGTLTSNPFGPYNPGVWDRISLDCSNQMEVHIDKIDAVSGLVNPGQPTTGTLVVHTTKDGGALAGVPVTIQGPTPGSGTTDATGTYTFPTLAPGSYSISGTYNSVTKSDAKTVTAGQTATSTLDFTVTDPNTGVITVYAADMYGNPVDISVTITGPTTQTKNTGTAGAVFTNLVYGTYQITGTYNTETKTDSKTVTSSSPTASSTLSFTSQYIPTWWDEFIKTARIYIDRFRTPLQILGGLITSICSIMLILPARSNTIRIAAPRTA